MLYRSDLAPGVYPSTAPVNAPISSNTQNAWRYWLSATSSTIVAATGGFYLTQDNDGYLRVYAKLADASINNTAVLCASDAPLTNGLTYCIKIQRNISGYWKMYLDQYSTSVTEAKSLQIIKTNASDGKAVTTTYTTSVLEAENKSGSNNIFRWDDMHMYTRYIKLSGINSPIYGIKTLLTPGSTNNVIHGVQIQMRGNYELGSSNTSSFVLKETDNGYAPGNVTPTAQGKLYRTTNIPFAVGTATLLNTVNFYSPVNTVNGGYIDKEVASGNPDGSLSTPVFFFLTTDVTANPTLGVSFTFSEVGAIEQYLYNTSAIGTVPITGTNGSSTAAPVPTPIVFGKAYDWKGGTATSGAYLWSTGANWVGGSAPGANDIARIGVVAYTSTYTPQVNSSTTVGSVIIGANSGNTVVLNLRDNTPSGQSLTINNGLTINSNSKLQITGGNSAGSMATLNLKNASTIAASGAISSASFTNIVNTGSLYLFSDASSSASIGTLTGSTLTNSGTTASTYVQRYLSPVRGYRLLSSPVYTNTSTLNYFNFNYLKSSAFVSGIGGSANGFDNTVKNNPTLYIYREDVSSSNASYSAGNFKGIEKLTAGSNSITANGANGTLTNGLPVSNGFMFYFVGNNSTSYSAKGVTSLTPEAVTLTAQGTINAGDVKVNLWYRANNDFNLSFTQPTGFNLVGNPYPSTINWDTNSEKGGSGIIFPSGTIDQKILQYNPVTSQYTYYDSSIGAGDGNGASQYIASGQAFFVKAKSTSATLTFKEGAKAATSQPPTLLMSTPSKNNFLATIPKESPKELPETIQLSVEKDSTHLDNIGIFFKDGWDAKYDDEDGADLDGLAATVFLSSYSSDSVRIALNKLPKLAADKTIVPLFMSANTDGLYTFKKVNIANIPAYYTVYLKDNYIQDSLDITHNSTYSFNLNHADKASYGRHRFQLIIQKTPLAYHLLDFGGKKETGAIAVNWKVDNEGDYTGFELEKLDANNTFIAVTTLKSTGKGVYDYKDYAATTGKNSYRLKQIDLSGNVTYSKTVVVDLSSPTENRDLFSVYPNPATEQIQVNLTNIPSVNYKFNIFSSSGSLIVQKNVKGSNYTENVSDLLPGVYIVELSDNTGKSMGKKKFIKKN